MLVLTYLVLEELGIAKSEWQEDVASVCRCSVVRGLTLPFPTNQKILTWFVNTHTYRGIEVVDDDPAPNAISAREKE